MVPAKDIATADMAEHNTRSGRSVMSKFNQNEVRSTVAAALLTIVFSTVCVLGAVGPARAAQQAPVTVDGPLA